ncbi:MAG TPA: hypothetical protein VFX85_00990 [Solirubrobacterales bacterium]|nr:hypothetical protein [Solirubrobacterales bacterium]
MPPRNDDPASLPRRLRTHLIGALFADPPRRRSTLAGWEGALVVAALLVLAIVLQLARLGWSSSLNALWAEDGPIYMQEALLNGTWDAISATYATYLVVVPRLIAEVASLAPLQDVPAAVSILSAAVVGLSGLVVWHASAGHLRNPYLRGTLAVLTVLTPVAGLESIDSAAYVPWYMLFASFWILLWRPATWRGTLAGAAFILLTGLSTPGLWFFAPLALLRGIAVRDRSDFAILGAYAAGALAQVPVLATTDETAVTPVWTHDIWTVFLQRIVDGAPLGLRLGGNAWVHLGWPLLIALLLAAVVGFAIGFRRSGAGARWITAVALPTALVMFVISLYQRAVGTPMLWPESFYHGAGSRYAIVPALLVISAALVLIDSRERSREPATAGWRRRATPATAAVAVLAIAVVTSFWARELSVRGAPPWDAALDAAALECVETEGESAPVETSPPGFGIQISCTELASFGPRP